MSRSALSVLRRLRGYRREDAVADLVAAAIVTLMLVPQSLAYAMLAGLPPQAGLYASILPLLAYALLGSSRTLGVGPVAVVSLMTAAAVGKIAAPGTPEYTTAALTLAAASGLVLLGMALLRLGWLANYLSHPVVSGFISATAVVIAAGQLKHLLGVPADGDSLVQIVPRLIAALPQANAPTVAIGLATLGFLVWARQWLKPLLQRLGLSAGAADLAAKVAPALAVAVSVLVVWLGDLSQAGVKTVGVVPSGLPALTWPSLEPALWRELLPAAVLISLIGFVESVSVAQTLAAKRRERISPDRELTALGAANLAAAVSGGYPVSGSLARSVVNFNAGARTAIAGVWTAAGIALLALLFAPLFLYLAQAVLAATIIVAVLSLVDLPALKRTWTYSKTDFAAMAATIAGVLAVGVETGVVAGVATSIALLLWESSRPHVAVVGLVPGTKHFRNVRRHRVVTSRTVLSVRVDGSLYFANTRYLEDCIYDQVVTRPELKHVVLMCTAVNRIDASALEGLESLVRRLADAGVTLHLAEVKGPVMDRLKRSDFLERLTGQVFLSQFQALQALDPAVAARAHEPA